LSNEVLQVRKKNREILRQVPLRNANIEYSLKKIPSIKIIYNLIFSFNMNEDEDQYHSTFIGSKDILEKCCLTEEEMNEYLKITEHIDPKEEHDHAYRTMMNETRRDLLKYIDTNIRSLDEIIDKFQLEDTQLKYHLSMLEQLYYLMNTEGGWKATPRGLGFLYYTILR
jgi:hypothetical protein